MHKHLKEPLRPPDHINTALSAGISEIIEVAMAKNRDERYSSTEDMLEDLRAVRAGNSPVNARHIVSVEELDRIEETGKTVDIAPPTPSPLMEMLKQPAALTILIIAALSVLINLILVMLFFTSHK
jgi:serine/threonine-protein kinase